MKEPKFTLEEDSKANKFYVLVDYMGGDTEHPEEYEIEGVDAHNYMDHLDSIEKVVEEYKDLDRALDAWHTDSDGYEKTEREYGEKIAKLFDYAPNDPQCDYQFKCTVNDIKLVRYAADGSRYESYT